MVHFMGRMFAPDGKVSAKNIIWISCLALGCVHFWDPLYLFFERTCHGAQLHLRLGASDVSILAAFYLLSFP